MTFRTLAALAALGGLLVAPAPADAGKRATKKWVEKKIERMLESFDVDAGEQIAPLDTPIVISAAIPFGAERSSTTGNERVLAEFGPFYLVGACVLSESGRAWVRFMIESAERFEAGQDGAVAPAFATGAPDERQAYAFGIFFHMEWLDRGHNEGPTTAVRSGSLDDYKVVLSPGALYGKSMDDDCAIHQTVTFSGPDGVDPIIYTDELNDFFDTTPEYFDRFKGARFLSPPSS
jgi:hypothetical protein